LGPAVWATGGIGRDGDAAVCSADHAVFARFNGRSTEAWHSIANGPHRSGALHSRHFDVMPAAHRLTNWDAGIDRLEYLAVFLPRGRDSELWATLCKIKRPVERPDTLLPSYHGHLLDLLAMELGRAGALRVPRCVRAKSVERRIRGSFYSAGEYPKGRNNGLL
jgi:hypothetical protein